MIEPILLSEIQMALETYRQAIANTADGEDKEDYLRLSSIAENIIISIQTNDLTQLKLNLLGFSRQVSDSFAPQPPELKPLAQGIAKLKKFVIHIADATPQQPLRS